MRWKVFCCIILGILCYSLPAFAGGWEYQEPSRAVYVDGNQTLTIFCHGDDGFDTVSISGTVPHNLGAGRSLEGFYQIRGASSSEIVGHTFWVPENEENTFVFTDPESVSQIAEDIVVNSSFLVRLGDYEGMSRIYRFSLEGIREVMDRLECVSIDPATDQNMESDSGSEEIEQSELVRLESRVSRLESSLERIGGKDTYDDDSSSIALWSTVGVVAFNSSWAGIESESATLALSGIATSFVPGSVSAVGWGVDSNSLKFAGTILTGIALAVPWVISAQSP